MPARGTRGNEGNYGKEVSRQTRGPQARARPRSESLRPREEGNQHRSNLQCAMTLIEIDESSSFDHRSPLSALRFAALAEN
jgi:hypothetical protein